jgi:hypothetical protein
MICQSWKVMFQAEYSSGQPLRMLVDLRAAIDDALGRGAAPPNRPAAGKASPRTSSPAAVTNKPAAAPAKSTMAAKAAAAGQKRPATKFSTPASDAPEFEVSGSDWNPNSENQ